MIGSVQEILVEKGNAGYTACFAPIRITPSPFAGPRASYGDLPLHALRAEGENRPERGSLVMVRVTGISDGKLTGILAA
jgi:hypothetical protein